MSKWISPDIKPDSDGFVIVSIHVKQYNYFGRCEDEHDIVCQGRYEDGEFRHMNKYPINESRIKRIVAWMPLPEPCEYMGGECDDET